MQAYATSIRRALHQYPEVGFDLERTLALLRRELDTMGVAYTEQYGKSSLIATINPEKSHFTIGIRADTDALPMQEVPGREYGSKIDGKMHACGHDAHTAIALATVKKLHAMREQIDCCVKVLFQSAEEYSTSGARLMVEDGVMEDIDCIVALHCDVDYDAGTVALVPCEQNAVSHGFRLHFTGKSAHAAEQHKGVDAILLAVRAYTALEMMIAKEIKAQDPVVFNVGVIQGGTTNNIVASSCSMFCTLRTHRAALDEQIIGRVKAICESIALSGGGSFSFEEVKYYPVVYNDPVVTERLKASATKVLGEVCVLPQKSRGMGGEDFSYMTQQKPGAMLWLGVRNEKRGITAHLHQTDFDIDEAALAVGVNIFTQFVIDNMHGIKDLSKTGTSV
ncbi:MAG: amidohydrolase [Clostridia bacterium]|nr:amidohydrolase [Clostridia bacterium]